MLHTRLTPSELYTRVDLDARIEGSSGQELTGICFDALLGALSRAQMAAQRGNRYDAVSGLARAASVLGGLQRAVDMNAAMGDVLAEFYGSIALRVRDLIRAPSAADIAELRVDVADVAAAIVPQRARAELAITS